MGAPGTTGGRRRTKKARSFNTSRRRSGPGTDRRSQGFDFRLGTGGSRALPSEFSDFESDQSFDRLHLARADVDGRWLAGAHNRGGNCQPW